MVIHFFKNGVEVEDQINHDTTDDSTIDFLPDQIVNVDRDDPEHVTAYTGKGNWYITLTVEEVKLLSSKIQ